MRKPTTELARYMREYQAKRRGSVSYKSAAEDASVLIAFALGLISEGRAAKAIYTDRVSLRGKLEDMVRDGCKRAGAPCEYNSELEAFSVTVGVNAE